MKFFRERVSDESGQSLVEYGILISFVMLSSLLVTAGRQNSMAGIANTVLSSLAAAKISTGQAIKRAVSKIETSVSAHVSSNEEFSRKVVAKSMNHGIETSGRAPSKSNVATTMMFTATRRCARSRTPTARLSKCLSTPN